MLTEWRERLNRSHRHADSGWVFPSKAGKPHHNASGMGKAFEACLKDIGVDRRFSSHGLRRTANDLIRRVASGEVARAITESVTFVLPDPSWGYGRTRRCQFRLAGDDPWLIAFLCDRREMPVSPLQALSRGDDDVAARALSTAKRSHANEEPDHLIRRLGLAFVMLALGGVSACGVDEVDTTETTEGALLLPPFQQPDISVLLQTCQGRSPDATITRRGNEDLISPTKYGTSGCPKAYVVDAAPPTLNADDRTILMWAVSVAPKRDAVHGRKAEDGLVGQGARGASGSERRNLRSAADVGRLQSTMPVHVNVGISPGRYLSGRKVGALPRWGTTASGCPRRRFDLSPGERSDWLPAL